MKLFAAAAFILAISLSAINSVAQVAIPSQGLPPPYGDYQYHLPGLDEPRHNNRFGGFRPTSESRVLKKGPLAPAGEDRTAYAGFLKRKGTGLVRLLAQPTPAEKTKRPAIVWGGERYSFLFLSSFWSRHFAYVRCSLPASLKRSRSVPIPAEAVRCQLRNVDESR